MSTWRKVNVRQCDGGAGTGKFTACGQARQARPCDCDAKTVHGRAKEQCKCHL